MHRVDEPLVVRPSDGDIVGYLRQLASRADHRLGFRGHTDAGWQLQPAMARYFLSLPPAIRRDRHSYRRVQRRLIAAFEEGLLTNGDLSADAMKNTDTWEYGQHYGLPTPLLDWSYSPYVGLFFATHDPSPPHTQSRAVWVLDLDLLSLINSQLSSLPEQHKELLPKEDLDNRYGGVEVQGSPSWFNKRLTYQQGFFTRHSYFLSFEIWLRNVTTDLKMAWDVPLLRKVEFTLDESDRSRVLSELNLMNVNSRVLFPDTRGSAEYACDLIRHEQRRRTRNFRGSAIEP